MARLQPRFFLIVGSIIFIIIIIAGVVVSNTGPKTPAATPTPTPTITPLPTIPPVTVAPTPKTLTFTVASGIGINTVKVTNQNTGASINLIPADLPSSFKFSRGDTLTFTVIANIGYTFNAWVLGDGTFQSQNPYTVKPTTDITLEAHFLTVPQTQPED
jgi:hypothetical protein